MSETQRYFRELTDDQLIRKIEEYTQRSNLPSFPDKAEAYDTNINSHMLFYAKEELKTRTGTDCISGRSQ